MSDVKPEQKVVLTLQDLQEVLNYISTRPYAEVFKVVEVLKKSRTLEAVLADAQTPTQAAPTAVREVTEEAPTAQEA